ncbi:MAG: hypothetical protein U0840_07095 [Gemmataceae bacterium]
MASNARTPCLAWLVLLTVTASSYAPPFLPPRPPVRPPAMPTIRPPVMPPIHPPTFTPVRPGVIQTPRALPSAVQLQTIVRSQYTHAPGTALRSLGNPQIKSALPETTRLLLINEALHSLALRAEVAQPRTLLNEIQLARESAASFPEGVQAKIDRLANRVERRILSESLQSLKQMPDQVQWSTLANQTGGQLQQLRATFRYSPTRANAERTRVLNELAQLNEGATKLDQLERLEHLLDPRRSNPTDILRVQTKGVSATISLHTDGIQALEGLKGLRFRADHAPDARSIRTSVARVERALAELPGSNPSLGKKIQQELAVRSALEGHAQSYFELMPENGPPESAAQLLRDMKAVALGEGKTSSVLVNQGNPIAGAPPAAPKPPPGVEPLLPEAARESWRPPVRESARADLPPLDQASNAAPKMREKAKEAINAEKKAVQSQVQTARINLNHLTQRLRDREEEDRRRMSELQFRSRINFDPNRRASVHDGLEQLLSDDQILDALAQNLDEEVYLELLARHVGRPLTPFEIVLVRQFRSESRSLSAIQGLLCRGN